MPHPTQCVQSTGCCHVITILLDPNVRIALYFLVHNLLMLATLYRADLIALRSRRFYLHNEAIPIVLNITVYHYSCLQPEKHATSAAIAITARYAMITNPMTTVHHSISCNRMYV